MPRRPTAGAEHGRIGESVRLGHQRIEYDPLAGLASGHFTANDIENFVDRFRIVERRQYHAEPDIIHMRMAVDESGQHCSTSEIDLARGGPCQRKHILRRSGGQNFAIPDRQRLDHAVSRIDRVDTAIMQDLVCCNGAHAAAFTLAAMASATISACSAIIRAPSSGSDDAGSPR